VRVFLALAMSWRRDSSSMVLNRLRSFLFKRATPGQGREMREGS
jgi:hypothetical protein